MLGLGLAAFRLPSQPATLQIKDSLFDGNRSTGIALWGVRATIDRSLVRDTAAQESDGAAGFGISAARDLEDGALTLQDSAVLRSHTAGLRLDVPTTVLTRCQISESVTDGKQRFGDGVETGPELHSQRADLTVEQCLIEKSARAGVVFVAAGGAVHGSLLRANLLPIDLEDGAAPALADNRLEGNGSDAVSQNGALGLAPPPPRPPPLIGP